MQSAFAGNESAPSCAENSSASVRNRTYSKKDFEGQIRLWRALNPHANVADAEAAAARIRAELSA